MSIFKKLLLEETLFEDNGEEETNGMEEPTEEKEEDESTDDISSQEITDDNLDQVVQDAESGETSEPPTDDTTAEVGMEDITTTYKVTFNLGKHTNWSRVEAVNEEDAKQQVTDYVTKKWSDRKFEITEVEEFEEIEESLNESLSENVQGQGKYSDKLYGYLNFLQDSNKNDNIAYLASQLIRYCKEEDLQDLWIDRMESVAKSVGFEETDTLDESVTDARPIETGAAIGMATIIGDLIKDEYEAIEGYNSAIATAEAHGYGVAVNVLTEIQAEENIHVGQLLEVMKIFDPNADKVEDGQAEGAEQLSNPLGSEINL